jgi:hypothetical protein
MRMMLRARVNTAKGNEAVKNGTLPKVIGAFMERAKPEAAYFTLDNGERVGFFIFDMKDSSQMPSLGEEFFMELGADLQLTPVMNADDLKAGFEALAAQK